MKCVLALLNLVVEVCESQFRRRIVRVTLSVNLHKIRVDTTHERRVLKLTRWRSATATPAVQVRFK